MNEEYGGVNHACEGTCDSDCTCGCNEADKIEAALVFKRSQLLYDVRNMGFVEGDIMSDEQQDAKHQTQDIGEAGNVDRVTRVLNLAMSEVVEALYPYTKHDIPDGAEPLTDVLEEPDEYTIRLSLPGDFSATTYRLLRDLIHEWLVCRVLGDWLSITKPDAAANWLAKGEDMLAKVKKAIASRKGKIRRPMKPF